MNAKQRRKAKRKIPQYQQFWHGERYDQPVGLSGGIPGKLYGITATNRPLWAGTYVDGAPQILTLEKWEARFDTMRQNKV